MTARTPGSRPRPQAIVTDPRAHVTAPATGTRSRSGVQRRHGVDHERSGHRRPGAVPAQAGLRPDAGAVGRGRARPAPSRCRAVRRAAAPGPPAALRLPAGDRRRAGQLGGAQGAHARSRGAPARPSTSRTTRSSTSTSRASSRPASTAAATSSSGTPAPGEPTRPATRRPGRGASRPASCTSTCTARSCAAGSCSCARRPRRRRQGAVAAAAQARRVRRRRAGTPRTTRGRCSAAAPTTRSRPTRTGCGARTCPPPARPSPLPAADRRPPTRRRAARRSTRCGRRGRWQVFGRELRVTNLDKVLFPARPGEEPVTKRDLLRYAAQIAPTRAAVPARPGAEHAPIPERRAGQGLLAQGAARRTRRTGCPAGTTRTPIPARRGPTWWSTNRPRWSGRRTSARSSGTRGRPRSTSPHQPTYALIDLDPGGATSWDDLLVLARLHRTAFEHLGLSRAAQGDRAGAASRSGCRSRAGLDFDDTRAWVEQLSRTVGAVVPELVSWKWQVGDRGGLARLDYTQNADQQDPGRAVQPAARARRAGVGADRLGRARRSRAGARRASPSARIRDRLAERGDLFARRPRPHPRCRCCADQPPAPLDRR